MEQAIWHNYNEADSLTTVLNSLDPGNNFESITSKLITQNNSLDTRCEMPRNFDNEKSTLVQVMPFSRQASSRCLSTCYPDICRLMALLDHKELVHCLAWNYATTIWSTKYKFRTSQTN